MRSGTLSSRLCLSDSAYVGAPSRRKDRPNAPRPGRSARREALSTTLGKAPFALNGASAGIALGVLVLMLAGTPALPFTAAQMAPVSSQSIQVE
jgi:hypothetical protein